MTEVTANGPRCAIMTDVILYDGSCGLCQRAVRFVLRYERSRWFQFAPLQGAAGRAALARHHRVVDGMDTVCVAVNYGGANESLRVKSDAALYVFWRLGGVWRATAIARLVPGPLRDAVYDWVARRRYGWFGRDESCPLPAPRQRDRFIDDATVSR